MKKALLEKVERAKLFTKAKQPTRVNILAVDQATNCGYAYELAGKRIVRGAHGSWNLTKKTKESDGMKWLRFESLLRELVEKHSIQVIAYELPGGQHMGAKIHSAKLIAIIERLAAEKGIEYVEHSASAIKKFATGNGIASKEMMIEAARKKLDYQGNNDNEADALWMLMLTKSQLN